MRTEKVPEYSPYGRPDLRVFLGQFCKRRPEIHPSQRPFGRYQFQYAVYQYGIFEQPTRLWEYCTTGMFAIFTFRLCMSGS